MNDITLPSGLVLTDAQQPYLEQIKEIAQQEGLEQDPSAGFWHIAPYPTKESLAELYEHEYMEERYPLDPEFSQENIDTARRRYEPVLRDMKRFHPEGETFLDVGSFGCETLYLAKEAGLDVVGIEAAKNTEVRAQRYGLKVLDGFFEPGQTLVEPGFDYINLGFVLEHVPHPRNFLAEAHRCLSADGVICVAVPNDFNPYQLQALRDGIVDRPWWIVPDEHLNYFSAHNLSALLLECGFEPVSVYNTFPIDSYLLEGINYVMDKSVGKQAYLKRQAWYAKLEESGQSDVIEQNHRQWASEGVGREVFVIAKKRK